MTQGIAVFVKGHVLQERSTTYNAGYKLQAGTAFEYKVAKCDDCSLCVCAVNQGRAPEVVRVIATKERLPVTAITACVVMACTSIADPDASDERDVFLLKKVCDATFPSDLPLAVIGRSDARLKGTRDLLSCLCLEAELSGGSRVDKKKLNQLVNEFARSKDISAQTLGATHLDSFFSFMKKGSPNKKGHGSNIYKTLEPHLVRNLRQGIQWKHKKMSRDRFVSIAMNHGLHRATTIRAVYCTGNPFTFLSDDQFLGFSDFNRKARFDAHTIPEFDDAMLYDSDSFFRAPLDEAGTEMQSASSARRFARRLKDASSDLDLRMFEMESGDEMQEPVHLETRRVERFPITDDKIEALRTTWTDLDLESRSECCLVIDARCPMLRVSVLANRKRRGSASGDFGMNAFRASCKIWCTTAWTDDRTSSVCARILDVVTCGRRVPVRVAIWDNRKLFGESLRPDRPCTALRTLTAEVPLANRCASEQSSRGVLPVGIADALHRANPETEFGGKGGCLHDLHAGDLCVTDQLYSGEQTDVPVGGWVFNLRIGAAGVVKEIMNVHTKKRSATVRAPAETTRGQPDHSHFMRLEVVWKDEDSDATFDIWVSLGNVNWRPCDAFPIVCAHQLRPKPTKNSRILLRRCRVDTGRQEHLACWSWLLACARLCSSLGNSTVFGIHQTELHDRADNALHFLSARSDLFYTLLEDAAP
ncbi:hypothetical protein CYMTET_47742 [Cymbomonas tetramitiformis]|uniref:Uncharacterized protein n=1 Tax=Cymbomonas tetramitiformis TaxID=36881 RepID=A0AAE0BUS2_9CHLO|nr:hypothetical protein CYMTET_47742 [Cymbomonas tetramitiformis]|eukprot:gene410-762_t